jgi:hypothetical protein
MKIKTLIKQYFCKHYWITIHHVPKAIRNEDGFLHASELHIDQCYKCQLLKRIK